MSFFVPAGLVFPGKHARMLDERPNSEWEQGEVADCDPPDPFEPYVIFTPFATLVSLSAGLGSIEYLSAGFTSLSDFDYYVLRVTIKPPGIPRGFWHDPPICKFDPPFGYDTAGPDITTELDGTYVTIDGTAIVTTSFASGAGADTATIIRGYLVNPSPPLPSPDIDGNEFNSILWLGADIPDVTGSIFVTRGPGSGVYPGSLEVDIRACNAGEPVPETTLRQDIVGCA